MIVVKVGGSLFDHPQLLPGLQAYLERLQEPDLCLVAGGGGVTDAVRDLDRIHQLGEETAHLIALHTLSATADFLRLGLRNQWRVLDCYEFAKDDRQLPNTWKTTSDSLAARYAIVGGGLRLLLLKSIDFPDGTSWETASAQGWVDAAFPNIVASSGLAIEVVNFRRVLDRELSQKVYNSEN